MTDSSGNATGSTDRFSHERNTMVDGPKGPMLAHFCEDSVTGYPKPGSAERCLNCDVDTEVNRNE